jgi:carboxypeptidase Q
MLCVALLAGPFVVPGPLQAQEPPAIPDAIRVNARRLIDAATADTAAWLRLAELTDRFGPRLSGSENLERALDWIMIEMEEDGLENVHPEPVMVPHWVRGEEWAQLVSPRAAPLHMLGLGGSIGTPDDGIEAAVLVVGSFEELERRAGEAAGKIVLFDVPFTSYGRTVRYRTSGAVAAARAGAVASLIRSVGPFGMQTPHTGAMQYDDSVPKIPHGAVSMEDAMMMRRMQMRGDSVRVRLKMSARTLPDAPSRNVIAEIRGRTAPHEIVVIGCHIDSWDVGTGAIDDAGGCVAAWEALRLMKALDIRPRRTVRAVLWTNEENGLRGATAYRDAHLDEIQNHVLAIESDAGVFEPTGFGYSGSERGFGMVEEIGMLLEPIDAGRITRGGGGADIGPLMQLGVPGMGLQVQGSRYFWYHHTDADTVDKLDPAGVAESVAAMAVMAYVAADLPERIPFGRRAAR